MITGKRFTERLYSENQEEKLYSTGDEMLDNLLERAFCEGYELGQKEFGMMRQEIDKDKEKLYQDMKNKYPGLYTNKDFVAQYKTLSPEDQKYISNRDADEFTDYIWSEVDKRLTNERETTKLKRNDNNKK